MNSTTFTVTGPYGLHCRPSAYICLIGNLFFGKWEIVAIRPSTKGEVNAKSIMGLMTICVPTGEDVEFLSLMPDDEWQQYTAALGLLFYTLSEKAHEFRDGEYGPVERTLKQSQQRDRTVTALLRRLEADRLRYEGKDIINALLQAEQKELEAEMESDSRSAKSHNIVIHGNVYGPVQVDNVNAHAFSFSHGDIDKQLKKIELLLDESGISPVDREEGQFVLKRLRELAREPRSEGVVSHVTRHLTALKNLLMSGSGLFVAATPYFEKLCALFAG